MTRLYICALMLGIAGACSTLAIADNISVRFGTSINPPYQQMEAGVLTGRAIDIMSCIFNRIPGYEFSASNIPWLRAIQDTRDKQLDGWFLYLSDQGLDQAATFSAPLYLEKWYLISHSRHDELQLGGMDIGKVVTVLGSYQHNWLKRQNLSQIEAVSNIHSAMDFFLRKRAKHIVMDRDTFSILVQSRGRDNRDFYWRPLGYVKLGAYLSNSFLQQHPRFLDSFNQAAQRCRRHYYSISAFERDLLHSLGKQYRTELNTDMAAAGLHPPTVATRLSHSQIQLLDQQWQKEIREGSYDLIDQVLNNALSDYLRQLKADSQGLISEIIVTDSQGRNIAMSDLTSDYWQGDEDKFIYPPVAPEGIFVDEILFDDSTSAFTVQVSFDLYRGPEQTGLVTIGFNIDAVLQRLRSSAFLPEGLSDY